MINCHYLHSLRLAINKRQSTRLQAAGRRRRRRRQRRRRRRSGIAGVQRGPSWIIPAVGGSTYDAARSAGVISRPEMIPTAVHQAARSSAAGARSRLRRARQIVRARRRALSPVTRRARLLAPARIDFPSVCSTPISTAIIIPVFRIHFNWFTAK